MIRMQLCKRDVSRTLEDAYDRVHTKATLESCSCEESRAHQIMVNGRGRREEHYANDERKSLLQVLPHVHTLKPIDSKCDSQIPVNDVPNLPNGNPRRGPN